MYLKTMTLIALCVLSTSSLYAQQEDPPEIWTPELSMEYSAISQTAVSPDGQSVAYVVREPQMDGEESKYLSHIWLTSVNGGDPVQYTRGDHSATNPSFSPDGQWLAFTTDRSEKSQIWMMRVQGGEAFEVSEGEQSISNYRWSPDGQYFAYTMRDPDTDEEKKAKKEKRDVILVDQNYKYNHLYVIPVHKDEEGNREPVRLTEGQFTVSTFDWSPDGAEIVFAHQPDPRLNTRFLESDISKVWIADQKVMPLVNWEGVDATPFYSPDGQWIAFSSNGGQSEPIGLNDAFIIPSSGGTPTPLSHTHDRNVNLLGWAMDGSSVYFSESMGTTRELLKLPLDGEPEVLFPAEGVKGSFSMNAEQTLFAFTYENSEAPADVHVASLEKDGMVKITDLHRDVPKPMMGDTELISWVSADGMPIEGLLTYPVDYEPGTKYPLVLSIHGGPAGVYTQTFTGRPGIYMIQTFAQKGMAVLRPNPRGSTGYGKDFRYANVKDWGFGDYEDVMSGVDKVIEMGVAHPDSLAVMGWSYGGYLTSFTVTRTGRFKAASMGAGLPNLISMVTTTDIQDYLAKHMGGEFWDDYEQYEKHSAMYRIKNVTTPTQVIHGAEDLRVPFTQGQEFYRALDRLGVDTEMIVYPRTPHGPREPKLLMDVTGRIINWFEHHLERKKENEESAME